MPLVTRIPTGYDALTGEVRAWDWREVLTTEIRETMKVLIATEKPFAQKAVDGIRRIVEEAGYELALLEKYTDKAQLLEAVADVDALIIRSDKVTAEVIAAAPQLKIVVRAGAGYDNVAASTPTAMSASWWAARARPWAWRSSPTTPSSRRTPYSRPTA